MSTSTPARFDAPDTSDRGASDLNRGSQAFSSEAVSNLNSYKAPDVASATANMVNDKMLPGLQIDGGDKSCYAGEGNANKDGALNKMGDARVGNKMDASKEVPANEKDSLNTPSDNKSKEYEAETDAVAKSARDGNLGGPENEKAMQRHMEQGTLNKFVDDVNKKLEAAGSPHRLSASQTTQAMQYTEKLEKGEARNPMKHVERNPRATVNVTNTQTGHVSSTRSVASNPSRPGYYPPVPSETDF